MRVFLVILFFSTCQAFSQSIDLATISYRYGLPSGIESTSSNAIEQVGMINLKLPIVFNESNIWFNNVTYQYSSVTYEESTPGSVQPLGLHGFIIQSGWVKQINKSQAIQLLMVPRIMTDFQQFQKSHLQLGGIALFENTYHENLMMRYGLMYNHELFGNMFVPLIHLDWMISSRWSFSGMLPIYGKLKYKASEQLELGLSHFGLITSFQIGDPEFNHDYIERKSIDLSLYGRYKVVGNIYFETRFGYAVGRSYTQYGEGDEMDFRIAILSFGDNRIKKNVDFDPGPIIDFRIVYSLPIPE